MKHGHLSKQVEPESRADELVCFHLMVHLHKLWQIMRHCHSATHHCTTLIKAPQSIRAIIRECGECGKKDGRKRECQQNQETVVCS